MKKLLLPLLLNLAVFPACAREKRDINQELLVAFKTEPSPGERQALFKKYGLKEIEKVGSSSLYLTVAPKSKKLKEIISKIQTEPQVKFAEPNMKMRTFK